MVKKRPICKSCSNYLSPWGRTSSGKKRYGCNYCRKTKLYRYNRKVPALYALFRQYVLWGITYEILSSISGYSVPYLVEQFHLILEKEPPLLPPIDQSHFEEAFLLIDGLWFTKRFVLMAYRQSKTLILLHVSVMKQERGSKIAKDLKILHISYRFTGVVSDGGTGIKNAVTTVFGAIPHQICMAHMHRDILSAIGRKPKDERIQKLRSLADHMWLIESKNALSWWKEQISLWYKENRNFVHEKRWDDQGNCWYIHKGVRHALRILVSLPYTSFKFLDHPLMPKTTNELEAQFGHLGKRWLAHRGLKQERWEQFMKWFVYFYNEDKLSNSKADKDNFYHTKP